MRDSLRSSLRAGVLLLAAIAASALLAVAQTASVQSRITQAIDEANLAVLHGNTHPLARAAFDRGVAPPDLPAERMLLVLKRSPQQEAALETLLEQQQDASSPNYHQWLTPQQFGAQFGPSDQDIQTIVSWLQSHGFQVAGVSNGRTVIEFSGFASQVQDAFHTSIHRYAVNGQEFWANSSDPQIPAALAPVLAGVNTLYSFPRHAMHEIAGLYSRTKATGAVAPVGGQLTFPNPCSLTASPLCNFAVAPADFAKIYDVPNLLLSPAPTTKYNGDGVAIAVVGESDISTTDFANFRSLFGLPAPKLNVIVSGPDPGVVGGAETEADLDVQWSGAVAPNATIDYVISQSTEVSLGVDLAAQYAVDNNLAPVLSESFGICELFMGTADNTFYSQLWQQAAAEGITVTAAAGDGGSALCDFNLQTQGGAEFGLSVSGFASTPYNVAVGGTDFNDLNNFTPFWNTTPSDTPTVASAKGYIPEMTWNDTCTNQELFGVFSTTSAEQTCNNSVARQDGLVDIVAGSGGLSGCTTSDGQTVSSCSGGYAKPSWQTALTPGDGKRDLPDVALFASNGFNGSFYLICEQDLNPPATSCDPNAVTSDAIGVGGTSASTPAFAGVMALINQATGSRQGNANYILYQLAAQSGATCVSAADPVGSCVFYDVPSGSTIAMPCFVNSPNCSVSNPSDAIGVLSGYSTNSGYDLATGLGSVNAANLISKWMSFALTLKPSTTTLSLNSGSPVTITHGQAVGIGIQVTGSSASPTGNVSLIANTAPPSAPSEVTQQSVQAFVLAPGTPVANEASVSGTTYALPGGAYTVFARYPGDGTFSASNSGDLNVTVSPEPSGSSVQVFTMNAVGQAAPLTSGPYGSLVLLRGNVAGQSGKGTATGSINFTDGITTPATNIAGNPYKLNSQGYAETQGSYAFSPGTHSIVAAYGGDSSFNASMSSPTAFTIVPASTTTSATGSSQTVVGSPATLNATIQSATAGPIAPTGTVTFLMGTTPVATSGLSGAVVSSSHQASAIAGANTSSLPHGQDSITAQYSGDSNYAASTSAPFVVSVLYPTTVTTSASATSILQGQSVTFTAQVTTTQVDGPPFTGTVSFIGSISSPAIPISPSGQAQYTTNALKPPDAFVNASYSGDSNYAGFFMGNSASVTVTPAFTISANPAQINISAPGQFGTTTLTITGNSGFTGSAGLSPGSCSGLLPETSCSFHPSMISISSANETATTTLTISTTAPSTLLPASSEHMRPGLSRMTPAMALACLSWIMFVPFGVLERKRRWGAVLGLVLFAILLAGIGCGGGGGGGGGGSTTPTNQGTPVGVSNPTVTVTINGVTETVNLTMQVQ
jgi:Pro-kumamolisin, activation domain/Bacterial Ig-like domain (group 3)